MTEETSPALTDPDAVEGDEDGPGPATSLYGWLWRLLPGGRWLKLFIALLIVVAVVLVLFTGVFPWLEPRLPWVDVTVGDPGAGG